MPDLAATELEPPKMLSEALVLEAWAEMPIEKSLFCSLFGAWREDCSFFAFFFLVSSLPGALDRLLLQNSHFSCA